MLQTLRLAVAIVKGEGVLIDLRNTLEQDLHTTTGMPGLQKTGEGPATRTAEEGVPAGVMAGASNTRWWRERGEGRRCYDKGQQEGK